ncbi:MAG: hypothetical protein LBU90_01055 [Bacteroidales bacterium]|jgi:hypothetical protein|nr:hypothetical protein [Bacteroidales bacterium]
MKKIIFGTLIIAVSAICFSSCKLSAHLTTSDAVNTNVNLSQANFKVLGSFTGVATGKTQELSIKGEPGLLSQAKADLLNKAKAGGADLKQGSRALINVTTEVKKNNKHIVVTMTAEVIEFVAKQ